MQPGSLIGNIRILETLGEGGMGQVWLGVDERLGRQVAVKAIRPERRLDQPTRERFLREARLLSRLEHPRICRLYDLVEQGDDEFLVLELVTGRSLRDLELGELSKEDRLLIAEQVADALRAAHAMSVVHRDLKPENIMVGDEHRVTVLDFGLARSPDGLVGDESGAFATQSEDGGVSVTRVGDVMGTPRYMSPEQARGESVTAASDMYSFGLVLQELLTGTVPTAENVSPTVMVQKARWGEVELAGDLPLPLAQLVRRLTSLEPGDRPSATETLERLRWVRDAPRRRRQRFFAGAAVVGLVVAAVALAFALWQSRRSLAEARSAQAQAEAVSGFLEEMLASADPNRDGVNVKVVDVLDRAASGVEERFQDHPLEQAGVQHVMGVTNRALGRFDVARPLLEESAQIRAEALGADHPQTLQTRAQLGILLGDEGRLEEAEAELRHMLTRSVEALGSDHLDTVALRRHLAAVLEERARYDEAERLLRDAVVLLDRKLGVAHSETMAARTSLAVVLDRAGREEEAEAIQRETLELAERELGADHPQTLETARGLAVSLARRGRLDEAEALFDEVVDGRRSVLGPEHPDTLTALANKGLVVEMQGRLDEAEAITREVLEIRRRTLGDQHPDTVSTLGNLATTLIRQRRYEDAEPVLVEAWQGATQALGPEHPQTLHWSGNLATLWLRQGLPEKAWPLAVENHRLRASVLGEDHRSTLTAQLTVADCLYAFGRYREAEEVARDLYERTVQLLGEDHRETERRRGKLVRVLRKLGRDDEAAALEGDE